MKKKKNIKIGINWKPSSSSITFLTFLPFLCAFSLQTRYKLVEAYIVYNHHNWEIDADTAAMNDAANRAVICIAIQPYQYNTARSCPFLCKSLFRTDFLRFVTSAAAATTVACAASIQFSLSDTSSTYFVRWVSFQLLVFGSVIASDAATAVHTPNDE